MKSIAVLLLLGQDVLAERVQLTKQRNSAGSSHKREALNNRLKNFRDNSDLLDLHSKSLEALASKSSKDFSTDGHFQKFLRSFTNQSVRARKSSGVMDLAKRPSSYGNQKLYENAINHFKKMEQKDIKQG